MEVRDQSLFYNQTKKSGSGKDDRIMCNPDYQGISESKVSPSPRSDPGKKPTLQNGRVHSRSLKVVGPELRELEGYLCFTAKQKKWIQILKNVALDKNVQSTARVSAS